MTKRKYRVTPQNNPQIEEPGITVPTMYKYAYVIPKGTSRKEIKDLAADLAYEGVIPNPTAEEDPNAPTYRTIDDYEKLNTREHRILHRAYDRFKSKDERTELKALPTEEHGTPARRVINRKRVKETYKPYLGEIRQADPFDPVIISMRSRQNALEFARNHPNIDKFLHFIPVVNGM